MKENFGTLRRVNALYEIQNQTDEPGVWGNNPIIRQQPAIPPHPYQIALDAGSELPAISASSVRFWSDFNRVFYHPRSMVQLNLPTSHIAPTSSGQVDPIDQWSTGEELFKTEDQEHDLLDRDLRLFVEESDQLQGFQVLTGADDAWAGFAGRYVERLRDEFGRKSIWVWGAEGNGVTSNRVRSPKSRSWSRLTMKQEKRRHQAINIAKSSSLFSDQASLYMPLSSRPTGPRPSYLVDDIITKWQTSALQATALESATLPTRLANRGDAIRGLMVDIEQLFTNEVKRNILKVSLSAAAPSEPPRPNGVSHQDHRMVNGVNHDDDKTMQEPEKLDMDLFDRLDTSAIQVAGRQHTFSQALVVRGLEASAPSSSDRPSPYMPIVQAYSSDSLAPRPTSFPHIFEFRSVDQHASIATKAALSASTDIAQRLRSLGDMTRRWVDVDDREDLRADLLAKAEEYIDGWEDEDESDGD